MPGENSHIYFNETKENFIYTCKTNHYLHRSTVAHNITPRSEMLLFFWNLMFCNLKKLQISDYL